MTSDELRKAAERVLDGYVAPDSTQFMLDARAVADAYLATVREDDGEAISREWLLESGWCHWDSHYYFHRNDMPDDFCIVACSAGLNLRFGDHYERLNPTRGQLRNLLTALRGQP